MVFDKKRYALLFNNAVTNGRIKKSQETFKIKLFLVKAENNLLIAEHTKNITPSKDQPKRLH